MPEPPDQLKSEDSGERSFWRRRRWLVIGFGGLIGLIVLAGVLLSVFVSSTQPPEPGEFYIAPSPLPSGPPGAVIRSEEIEDPPAGSSGWKILFLSRSYTGKPTAVSGLLFVPSSPAPAGGRNVVAFTHGTVGVASKCAVSSIGPAYWPHIDGLTEFLRAGDVVVAPDYQGLGTPGPLPYLVGESEAWTTLDAVRAAAAFAPAEAGRRFVAWGASQGGHAALFTGQTARSYAPELELAGVAAAAPATNLGTLFKANRNGTFGRVLSAYTLDTWSQVYPELRIDQVATRVAIPVVRRIARICITGEGGPVAAALVSQALKLSYLRKVPWETEPWKGLIAINSPGRQRIPAPVIITQGEGDELVRPSITAAFARRLCTQGATLTFRTYPGVNHLRAGPATAADVAAWIAERFAGEPAPETCA